MTLLMEYFEIIVVAMLMAVTALLIAVLSYSRFFSKHFSNRKFQIKSGFQHEPLKKSAQFVISIYNNNINDTRITGFGFVFKRQNIDYFKTHLSISGQPEDAKIVIPSRDFVQVVIDDADLHQIVSDINRGKRRIGNLQAFVTDSLGLTSKTNAKQIRIQLARMQDDVVREKRLKEKAIRASHRLERLAFHRAKAIESAAKRQELWNRFIFWFKTTFIRKKTK